LVAQKLLDLDVQCRSAFQHGFPDTSIIHNIVAMDAAASRMSSRSLGDFGFIDGSARPVHFANEIRVLHCLQHHQVYCAPEQGLKFPLEREIVEQPRTQVLTLLELDEKVHVASGGIEFPNRRRPKDLKLGDAELSAKSRQSIGVVEECRNHEFGFYRVLPSATTIKSYMQFSDGRRF
jgi:hypothetical protein